MESAVQLTENFDKLTKKEFSFLPDLQDNGAKYTKSELNSAIDTLNSLGASCIILRMRAGILKDSVDIVKDTIKNRSDVLIQVYSEPYDRVALGHLKMIESHLGRENVFFELSETDFASMKASNPVSTSVPKTDFDNIPQNSANEARMMLPLIVLSMLSHR